MYGLTSAKFDNKFRDPRNIDNIVAKRGALFMVKLQHEVQARGYKVIHIKTDSIKIPNQIKILLTLSWNLVNSMVILLSMKPHIVKFVWLMMLFILPKIWRMENGSRWRSIRTSICVQNFVFKGADNFQDLIEVKSVKSNLYLDMNENLPEGEARLSFIGKVGAFCPLRLWWRYPFKRARRKILCSNRNKRLSLA